MFEKSCQIKIHGTRARVRPSRLEAQDFGTLLPPALTSLEVFINSTKGIFPGSALNRKLPWGDCNDKPGGPLPLTARISCSLQTPKDSAALCIAGIRIAGAYAVRCF